MGIERKDHELRVSDELGVGPVRALFDEAALHGVVDVRLFVRDGVHMEAHA